MLKCQIIALILAACGGVVSSNLTVAAERPNIVLIYCDDLGYGDASCYGATAIETPNIDRLAAGGLRFLDAHSSAAMCTPSRYAMLTGEYAFRKPGTGVLPGNALSLILPGRQNLASLLHDAGFATGVVGKWHLGLGSNQSPIDWNGEIRPGPLEIGFDSCFLIPGTGDRTPCVYVKDHRVLNLDPADPIQVDYKNPVGQDPTGRDNPELLKMHPSHGHDFTIVNGISRIGYMTGGQSARWVDEDMADVLTDQAVSFLESHQKEQPFFLYFAYHDIHVPRVPHPRFAGKSGMGPRGDAILQLDWCTGQILDTLDRLKLTDNTLVIFTSDNGPVVDDGYKDDAVEKLGAHRPAGRLRGGKGSCYEAGTRVPFIARWPGHVPVGVSSALVCQVDLPATFAALTGQPLATTAPDSVNILPALLDAANPGRDELVEQGRALCLRQGQWKLIPGRKNAPPPGQIGQNGVEHGLHPAPQLYNLADDLGEQHDLAPAQPERVQAMLKRLDEIEAPRPKQ